MQGGERSGVEPNDGAQNGPDVYSNLANQTEAPSAAEAAQARTHEELLNDPDLMTFSFRRHGEYERDRSAVLGGQINRATMPDIRRSAHDWVQELPEDAEVHIVASPTIMPITRPQGSEINPTRARATSALYGAELRQRFGPNRGYLDEEHLSPEHQGLRAPQASPRQLERRLGDIFEYITAGQSVQPFFKKLSETYGGLTPQFWHDFTTGELPKDLEQVYVENGGRLAIDKAADALDWLQEYSSKPHDEAKQVVLAISHEEVIRPLVYQIAEYLKNTGSTSSEITDRLESAGFSYNQGFDLHMNQAGDATLEIGGDMVNINVPQFKDYLDQKRAA